MQRRVFARRKRSPSKAPRPGPAWFYDATARSLGSSAQAAESQGSGDDDEEDQGTPSTGEGGAAGGSIGHESHEEENAEVRFNFVGFGLGTTSWMPYPCPPGRQCCLDSPEST